MIANRLLRDLATVATLGWAGIAGCASTGSGPGPELWFGSYVRVTTGPPSPRTRTGALASVTTDSVELLTGLDTIRIARSRITGLAIGRTAGGRGGAAARGAATGGGIGVIAGGLVGGVTDPDDGSADERTARGMAIGGLAGAALGAGLGALSADEVDWYVLHPLDLERLVGREPALVPASRRS